MNLPTLISMISPFLLSGVLGGMFHFFQILIEYSPNNEDSDQTTQYVMSYLGLHFLSISRTIWLLG